MDHRMTISRVDGVALEPGRGAVIEMAGFRCVERVVLSAGAEFSLLRRHVCRRGREWWKRIRVQVGVDFGWGADRTYEVEVVAMKEEI